MHFYVYRFEDGRYVYERTCGTEQAAKDRVKALGGRAVYLVDHLVKDAFY
jgi:hypothetical protein